MKRRTLLPVLVVGGLLAVAIAGAAFATSDRSLPGGTPGGDPGAVAFYVLTVDGREIGSFSDLVSLSSGVDAAELVSTTGDRQVRTLLPAKRSPDSVVLERGLSSSIELQAWHDLVLNGDAAGARKNSVLTMYSFDGAPVARYYLENAWPSKLELGELTGGTSSFVTETVTLVCDRIQRQAV